MGGTTLDVVVERTNGASGEVGCSHYTEDGSALEESDYKPKSGKLCFKPNQMTEIISLEIMPKTLYEGTEHFRVILKDPTGMVKFDDKTDGGQEFNILTVFID